MALTIAGSDSSAGAGLQADLKVFAARGVYGVNAVTSVVAETPGKVARIENVSAEMVRAQIALLRRHFHIGAAKTGMLGRAAIVKTVAAELRRGRRLPLVVDPVMIATSGDRLLQKDAVAIYEEQLFPLADLITPNLDEAEVLLGESIPDLKVMRDAVAALARKYRVNVLFKGGHLRGQRAVDLLFARGKIITLSSPFVPGVRTHGTGCTYSAAIAAELAKGSDLVNAVRIGKRVVTAAIRRHFRWKDRRTWIDALDQFGADAR